MNHDNVQIIKTFCGNYIVIIRYKNYIESKKFDNLKDATYYKQEILEQLNLI